MEHDSDASSTVNEIFEYREDDLRKVVDKMFAGEDSSHFTTNKMVLIQCLVTTTVIVIVKVVNKNPLPQYL